MCKYINITISWICKYVVPEQKIHQYFDAL
jgi:hypothetical protein